MGAAIKVSRTEFTPTELRAIAARSGDAGQMRRLLAIALILEGASRAEAAQRTGMDRQTLRDWVIGFNESGIDALIARKPPGPKPKLTPDQMAELYRIVLEGPDPKVHKVIHWRCLDLRAEVKRRFSVTAAERTIGKWLRKMQLTRLQARPFHPKRDAAAQEAFKKQARAGGPPGAVETVGAMFGPRGAAGKFLVDVTS